MRGYKSRVLRVSSVHPESAALAAMAASGSAAWPRSAPPTPTNGSPPWGRPTTAHTRGGRPQGWTVGALREAPSHHVFPTRVEPLRARKTVAQWHSGTVGAQKEWHSCVLSCPTCLPVLALVAAARLAQLLSPAFAPRKCLSIVPRLHRRTGQMGCSFNFPQIVPANP